MSKDLRRKGESLQVYRGRVSRAEGTASAKGLRLVYWNSKEMNVAEQSEGGKEAGCDIRGKGAPSLESLNLMP